MQLRRSPGGEHVEVAAEAAAGAAVVGDGDDGSEIGDEGRAGGLGEETGVGYAQLEPAEQSGEAGSSTDGDNAEASRGDWVRGFRSHRNEKPYGKSLTHRAAKR